MLRYCKLCLLLLGSCLAAIKGFAQDVGFSQFYDLPLLRNPALAGMFEGDIRATASYRNQWQSVTIPYRTFSLSTEVKLATNDVNYFTIGLQLMRDVAGTSNFSTTQILPVINYRLSFNGENNSYLSFAYMPGLRQQRFDPTKLVMNDQFVAGSNGSFSILPATRQVFDKTSVNYIDHSFGVSYNGVIQDRIDDAAETGYFIGLGMFHITSPNVGFFADHRIHLNRKLAVNAGLSTPTSDRNRLVFYADYFQQYDKELTAVGSTVQAGLLYDTDLFVEGDVQHTITFGALYRMNDAVIPVVQLTLSKFTVGVSYDVNIDKLAAASQHRGGLEVVISYRDFLSSRSREQRQTMCPNFRR